MACSVAVSWLLASRRRRSWRIRTWVMRTLTRPITVTASSRRADSPGSRWAKPRCTPPATARARAQRLSAATWRTLAKLVASSTGTQ